MGQRTGNNGGHCQYAFRTQRTCHIQWRFVVANGLSMASKTHGLVDLGFEELANRWLPLLNHFEECGVDVCYEVHPGEDLHDGISYEMFLDKVNHHKRACLLYDPSHFVLQQLDYLEYIDLYHERIKMFHVKDAEFNPSGRCGVYGGYQSWANRAGRFRSPGMVRLTLGPYSASCLNTIIKVGRCWNGSAVSNRLSRVLLKGLLSLKITSYKLQIRLLMTLPEVTDKNYLKSLLGL